MDAVGRIMAKIGYNTEIDSEYAETWDEFVSVCAGKVLVLFGAGQGADLYYLKYGESAFADAIVDSDPQIQGHPAQKILFEKIDAKHQNIIIQDPSIIDHYDRDKLVVLISSLRHYAEIREKLVGMGVRYCYSVFCMEAAYRMSHCSVEAKDRQQEYQEWCKSLPLVDNKVVLITTSDGAGHGKNIVKEILRKNKNIDLVWLVRDCLSPMPNGVRSVFVKYWRDYIYEIMTAKIWLADTGVPVSLKRSDQVYIQMKHWASITLKMFGYDELKYRGEEDFRKLGVNGFDQIDYVLVGSRFDEKTCRSGFRFNGEVKYVGSPRSDTLFHDNAGLKKLKKMFGISEHEHCALFAPTYRIVEKGSVKTQFSTDLNFEQVKNVLQKTFMGEWKLLLRLHPFVAKMKRNKEYPDFVKDVSDYYDSEELVAISDIMITDYSSIMFEPAFIGKPVFLFANDRKEYLEKERGFLIDYDSLPFPIADSNDQLVSNIVNFNLEEYRLNVAAFLEKYGVHEDGHASERAAKFIVGLLEEKER